MEIINKYNNFLLHKYSDNYYDKVISGLTIHHLSYLKSNLIQGNKCLVVFPNDIVEDSYLNILTSDLTLLNMFMLHLRNLTLNKTDNPIQRKEIDEKYTLNTKLMNENFNHLIKKYSRSMSYKDFVVKLPTSGLIFQNMISTLLLNRYLDKVNCQENKIRVHFHFMFYKLKYFEPNHILMRELTELYHEYRGKLHIKTYSEVEAKSDASLIIKDKSTNKSDEVYYGKRIDLKTPFKTLKKSLHSSNNEVLYKDSIWVRLFSSNQREVFIANYLYNGRIIRESLIMKETKRAQNTDYAPMSYEYSSTQDVNQESNSFISSRMKYFNMKLNQIRNYLEEQYVLQAIKWKQGTQHNEHIPDIEIFPSDCDDLNHKLDTNTNTGEDLNFLTDKLISYYPNRDVLRYLLGVYGEKGTMEILFSQKGQRDDIILAQVQYEIKHRFLTNPFDFYLKRHDYSQLLKGKECPSKFLKVHTLFAKEFNYDIDKYKKELFKFLIFIHLI